ncbi:hypothetical protein ND16A_2097 [Thalassotalea sp. ND16A]|nr:hypothetical protein ND16A_2097 [Thalassotalea sp. ND16A]
MNKVIMKPLAKRLEVLGYDVENISYPSTKADKARLFNTIDQAVADGPALMLGHSLGGLVITDYLFSQQVSTDKVPMVITLGTPHQGAEITKDMAKLNLDGLLGSSPQFGLIPKRFKKSWPVAQKLISIAGNVKLGARPLLDRVWREEVAESDGTVSIFETQIPGMSEHIIVRQSHTSMVYSREVVKIIDHYARQLKQ